MPAWLTVASVLVLSGTCGCFRLPAPTLHEEDLGRVYVLPGVNSATNNYGDPYRAFRDAGVDCAVHISEWDSFTYDMLKQLTDHERNVARAQRVATEIVEYRRAHPDAPVYLVGYSAGGGIAVLIAEALPDDVHLENIVLVQSAISPRYNLSRVLAHVDGRIVCFYSPLDVFVLGLGTGALGTVDRQHTASVGQRGFDVEAAIPDTAQRSRLIQQSWEPSMVWSGHLGNHLSLFSYAWNRKYVAPWLMPTHVTPACGK